MNTYEYNPCSTAILKRLLLHHMVETEVDLNYFYISLKKLVEKYPFLQKWSINKFCNSQE